MKLTRHHSGGETGFLPEDYLARKSERRTNVIAITLFTVVTFAVVGAFFVTNREWNDVRQYTEAINVRYAQAAMEIEQLRKLEDQKSELIEKAELVTALIERVPRSLLLAELINRMPGEMTLLELQLASKRTERMTSRSRAATESASSSKSLASRRSRGSASAQKAAAPAPTVTAPQYETRMFVTGVAPTHSAVAQYVAQLQTCQLIENIELKFSDRTIIRDREMFRFRIEASIRPDADARDIEPERTPRIARPATQSDDSGSDVARAGGSFERGGR